MILSLVAMTELTKKKKKCCITNAYLQWLFHSGERAVVRVPLVFVCVFFGNYSPTCLVKPPLEVPTRHGFTFLFYSLQGANTV